MQNHNNNDSITNSKKHNRNKKNPHQINDEDFLFSHSVPIAIGIFQNLNKIYCLITLMICCLLFSITLTK
jgi:hypothetical protein